MADIKPDACPYCGAAFGMTTGCSASCDGWREHRALITAYIADEQGNLLAYRHLRAWGQFQHSAEYYIREQVKLAREERAPFDAIYRRSNGEWARYREVTNADTRFVVDNIVAAQERG